MTHTVNQVFLEFTSIINYVHFILLTNFLYRMFAYYFSSVNLAGYK